MLHPQLPNSWLHADWMSFIDMIKDFGFNVYEFWLVPRLFCRSGLDSDFGKRFTSQMQDIIDYAADQGMATKMFCSLATVGADWRTYCPNVTDEWDECLFLWDQWTKRLHRLGMIGIFPGDPGACSRNGCTPETFIDKAVEVSDIIKKNQPDAQIELNTWGNPFFGWGCIEGPDGWQGEFVQDYQHTAWTFSRPRADRAMTHLLKRLKHFPEYTAVAINLAFNPDADPKHGDGEQSAQSWAREIAKTNPILTWDFSLTEGENAIIPHYRFERLFSQRKREREAAPYQGGMCYTMTPMLNQLSLYQAAQSFIDPDADHREVTRRFYSKYFGYKERELLDILPLFEIVPDWGNGVKIDIAKSEYRRLMLRGSEIVREIKRDNANDNEAPFHPAPKTYLNDLMFFFDLFACLSDEQPDFAYCRQTYWNKVYEIYNDLPTHVDPRPTLATNNLIRVFDDSSNDSAKSPMPGRWI